MTSSGLKFTLHVSACWSCFCILTLRRPCLSFSIGYLKALQSSVISTDEALICNANSLWIGEISASEDSKPVAGGAAPSKRREQVRLAQR